MRGSYSGNTLAFQAKARSSILLPRSKINMSTLHNIFPTAILVDNFKPTDELIKFSKSFNLNPITPDLEHIWGSHSEYLRVLRSDICSDLRKYILDVGTYYANELLCYNVDRVIDILSWLSFKSPGNNHIPHMHPNSFISCTYYFEEIHNSTPLVFKKPKGVPINTFELTPPFNHDKSFSVPTATEHYEINPKSGDIVFFPSYMYHFVPQNNTNKIRTSMAVNMMPVNSLGEDTHITTFKYLDAHNH